MMLPGLVGIAFNWTARGIFLAFISPRLWWGEMRHSLSEAQREGLFLTLRYIVITFDFLGINLVIWAQLQVLYLILVLTNGMNRIKKKLSALIDLLDTCGSTWFFFKLGLWQDAFWKLSRDTRFGMTKSPGPPYGPLTHGSRFPLDHQNKSFLDLHLM